jgi:hypothetical protein
MEKKRPLLLPISRENANGKCSIMGGTSFLLSRMMSMQQQCQKWTASADLLSTT